MQIQPQRACPIITACCILFNISKDLQKEATDEDSDDSTTTCVSDISNDLQREPAQPLNPQQKKKEMDSVKKYIREKMMDLCRKEREKKRSNMS